MPDGYALPVSLGTNIRKFRRAVDLDQTGLGRAIGVGQGAVSRWETGESLPDADSLPIIARLLRVSLDELLQGVDSQYDAARDLPRHASTRASAAPKEGAANVPAEARIRQLEGDLAVYKAIVKRSRRLAEELLTVTGRRDEGSAVTRASTKRRANH